MLVFYIMCLFLVQITITERIESDRAVLVRTFLPVRPPYSSVTNFLDSPYQVSSSQMSSASGPEREGYSVDGAGGGVLFVGGEIKDDMIVTMFWHVTFLSIGSLPIVAPLSRTSLTIHHHE